MVRSTVSRLQFLHVEVPPVKSSSNWPLYIQTTADKQETTEEIDSIEPNSRKRRRTCDCTALEDSPLDTGYALKKVDELRQQVKDLESALEDEKATSSARKNVNTDHLARIRKQYEVEQLLRQELKSVWAESNEATQAAKGLEERLHAENEKYRRELFTMKSTKDDSHRKVAMLEEELKEIKITLAESEEATMAVNREIKRKELFISDLHRQGDEQDQKNRLYDKEVERLKILIEDAEKQYWSREREFGAKILALHQTTERQLRERDQEVQNLQKKWRAAEDQRVEVLKHQTATLGTTKQKIDGQSTSIPLNSPQKPATTAEMESLRRENQELFTKLKHLDSHKDASQHGSESSNAGIASLQEENQTLRTQVLDSTNTTANQSTPSRPSSGNGTPGQDNTASPSSSSTGQAYLKLLRAHELLQKERDLLVTQLQDLQRT